MSDTPRTDAAILRADDIESGGTFDAVHAQVSRQLERELAEVTKQRDELVEALRNCREDSVELLSERSWWQNEPRCDYQTRYAESAENIRKADSALAAAEGGDK